MTKLLLLLVCFIGLAANAVGAESIVIVGDSLSCGPFGKYLVQDLSRAGYSVALYCAVSSAPQNWLKGINPPRQICKTMKSSNPRLESCGGDGQVPKLDFLLANNSGARFIVALGTNSLLSPKADTSYRSMAKIIKIHEHECTWIGPPQLNPSQSKGYPAGRVETEQKNLTDFYKSLGESVDTSCELIDSREATAPGTAGNETGDGIHRTDGAGKYWSSAILKSILHHFN